MQFIFGEESPKINFTQSLTGEFDIKITNE